MNEERFDRLEKIMEQLVTMVGNNNSSIEELRQDNKEIKQHLDRLETKIDAGFKNTKEANDALLELIEKTYREAEPLPRVEAKLDILAKRLFENEAEISLLKRAK
ncbi:MAG: hypothetical protein H6Q71_681 [Firmicutes bacterium]|nr:hypothetical protein [Bacillota bacterium]